VSIKILHNLIQIPMNFHDHLMTTEANVTFVVFKISVA